MEGKKTPYEITQEIEASLENTIPPMVKDLIRVGIDFALVERYAAGINERDLFHVHLLIPKDVWKGENAARWRSLGVNERETNIEFVSWYLANTTGVLLHTQEYLTSSESRKLGLKEERSIFFNTGMEKPVAAGSEYFQLGRERQVKGVPAEEFGMETHLQFHFEKDEDGIITLGSGNKIRLKLWW